MGFVKNITNGYMESVKMFYKSDKNHLKKILVPASTGYIYKRRFVKELRLIVEEKSPVKQ